MSLNIYRLTEMLTFSLNITTEILLQDDRNIKMGLSSLLIYELPLFLP